MDGREVVIMVMSSAATNAAAQREVMMIEVWRRLRLGLGIFCEASGFETQFSETFTVFSIAMAVVAGFCSQEVNMDCVLVVLILHASEFS